MNSNVIFSWLALLVHCVFILIYVIFSDYGSGANARMAGNETEADKQLLSSLYPYFQDVQMMIFMGFGFLMTFLGKYSHSSVGLNLFLAAIAIEWSLLVSGFFSMSNGIIYFTANSLISAEFMAASVLITFGALLGKTTALQLMIVVLLEVPVFMVNEYIGRHYFGANDVGDSMFVHLFGAFFGITVARVIYKKEMGDSPNNSAVYHSDVFAMIGTIVLWVFWPSFNAAAAAGDARHRAVINTFCSIMGGTVATFIFSALFKKGKLTMAHVQNATLAGGVAIGTAADMMLNPGYSVMIGTFAGLLSVVGFEFLMPRLEKKGFHDTCGAMYLHGLPGFFAGHVGALVAVFANKSNYGDTLFTVFPLLQDGRTALAQAGFQLAAVYTTIVFAIVGGLITGFILRIPKLQLESDYRHVTNDNIYYNDAVNWELPPIGIVENAGDSRYRTVEDAEA